MYSWTYIEQIDLTKPVYVDVSIADTDCPDPAQNGYVKTLGEPQGQEADYEKPFSDGKRIHLRKYKGVYKAHWDFFSPIISPIQHLRYDAPGWYVASTTLGCSALGASLTEDKATGAVLGGALGFVIGMLSLPNDD